MSMLAVWLVHCEITYTQTSCSFGKYTISNPNTPTPPNAQKHIHAQWWLVTVAVTCPGLWNSYCAYYMKCNYQRTLFVLTSTMYSTWPSWLYLYVLWFPLCYSQFFNECPYLTLWLVVWHGCCNKIITLRDLRGHEQISSPKKLHPVRQTHQPWAALKASFWLVFHFCHVLTLTCRADLPPTHLVAVRG